MFFVILGQIENVFLVGFKWAIHRHTVFEEGFPLKVLGS
jgi:hypothetical protein